MKKHMKRLIFCSSVWLMLVFAGLCFADEHFPFLGEMKRGPVNVRAGANTNFESVDKLVQGAEVVVLGQSYEWYKIQLPSTAAAFIRADYMEKRGPGIGALTGDKVNVRAKPNSESSTLGQLHKGDLVKLIEQTDDGCSASANMSSTNCRGNWWKVEPPPSAAGWVHADFVGVKSPQVPDQMVRKPIANTSSPNYRSNWGKPLTADLVAPVSAKLVPAATPNPVVRRQGLLLPLIQASAAVDVHYQIVVDGKPVYYVQDAPHLEHFSRAQVSFEGSLLSGDKTTACPVLDIKKITLIL
ncbi:MAG: SH3 domain-containing protein [Candidatus Omnitrophica bacterium]|nr:SH3 domain-containing protein [Candidatus Omnitrophota bacterium]